MTFCVFRDLVNKFPKTRDLCLVSSGRSETEIWQASRQQCCRDACQIPKRHDNLITQSRGFETLRNLIEKMSNRISNRFLLQLVPEQLHTQYLWIAPRPFVFLRIRRCEIFSVYSSSIVAVIFLQQLCRCLLWLNTINASIRSNKNIETYQG